VYKVFEEISSENSSFSEVSDVIMARRSTRLLTVVADIVAQCDSENEFMEDILDGQDSENDHAGPVHDGQGPLIVYNHVLAPKGFIWTIWDNYQLHRMKV
jgi:predicted CopG family antitoxin